jgi:hypothetical protein
VVGGVKRGKCRGQNGVQRGYMGGTRDWVSRQLSAMQLRILDAWHGMQRAKGREKIPVCVDSRGWV